MTFRAIINKIKKEIISSVKMIKMKFKPDDLEFEDIHVLLNNRNILLQNKIRKKIVFCNLPIERGRFFNQIIKSHDYSYPSIQALEELHKFKPEDGLEYLENTLVAFAEKNADLYTDYSSYIGIPLYDTVFQSVPPWSRILPWQKIDEVEEFVNLKNFSTLIENSKRGINLDAINGGSQFPLTSAKRAKFEAKLLYQLYQSIKEEGFNLKKNILDPAGCILLVDDKGSFAWISSAGIHRVTVLASLGHENVPLLIKKIVYRDSVKEWYMVQNGLCSENLALKLFDSIFQGRKIDYQNDSN